MTQWECKHLYYHQWWEWSGLNPNNQACTIKGTYSCTYYWKNPHLIKDFVSQYSKIRYYWTFSVEGQNERKKLVGDRSNGLSGHSGPASIIMSSYDNTFRSHTDSKNFPHEFNPNTVCLGCKFFLK